VGDEELPTVGFRCKTGHGDWRKVTFNLGRYYQYIGSNTPMINIYLGVQRMGYDDLTGW